MEENEILEVTHHMISFIQCPPVCLGPNTVKNNYTSQQDLLHIEVLSALIVEVVA